MNTSPRVQKAFCPITLDEIDNGPIHIRSTNLRRRIPVKVTGIFVCLGVDGCSGASSCARAKISTFLERIYILNYVHIGTASDSRRNCRAVRLS